jgi:hypothetical protein
MALGQALFRLGDLAGAVDRLAHAVPVLAAAASATAREVATSMQAQLDDWQRLLTVAPDEIPERTRALQQHFAAISDLSRAGEVETAAQLFDADLAIAGWLRRVSPAQELLAHCVELGLATGVTATYAGRWAAAENGYRRAGDCLVDLYAATGLPEYLDRWCDAMAGMLATLVYAGMEDLSDQLALIDAELRRLDPAAAAQRAAAVRSALATMTAPLQEGKQ